MEPQTNRTKPRINVVFLGHVDAGKSTVVGQLTMAYSQIGKTKVLKKYIPQSEQYLHPFDRYYTRFSYASFMYKNRVERDRGITIDVGYKKFETNKYDFTLFDAPGHRDFIKNMIVGTSSAHYAVLVVAAPFGQFQAGASRQGQTREHLMLAYSIGVKQLIVCINKMDDKTVNYSQDRYLQIKIDLSEYLKKVGYKPDSTLFVPISGWIGDNIFEKSPKLEWYKGPTLIQALDSFEPPKRLTSRPLRMTVQKAEKIGGVGTVILGKVQYGVLRPGMNISFSSLQKNLEVKSIQILNNAILEAVAGDYIGVNIKGIAVRDVRKGDLLGQFDNHPPKLAEEILAHIIILNHPNRIQNGYSPVVHCHMSHVTCKFDKIKYTVDRANEKILELEPRSLKNGDTAMVILKPLKPFSCQLFSDYPSLGRLIIRDSKQTVAVGIIKDIKLLKNEK